MTAFWHDLRYALRLLRFSPGFTFMALLTLALGIGANTAIFQLIDAIRLRTIPVRNPQELATIRIADRTWGSGSFSVQYSQLTFPLWDQIRKQQEGLQRTKEIGIRMAIGAQGPDVIRMVMREAGILMIIGLAAGTSLAFASAQVAQSMLFGLKPHDPLTFAGP
jgi:hypothetical protein